MKQVHSSLLAVQKSLIEYRRSSVYVTRKSIKGWFPWDSEEIKIINNLLMYSIPIWSRYCEFEYPKPDIYDTDELIILIRTKYIKELPSKSFYCLDTSLYPKEFENILQIMSTLQTDSNDADFRQDIRKDMLNIYFDNIVIEFNNKPLFLEITTVFGFNALTLNKIYEYQLSNQKFLLEFIDTEICKLLIIVRTINFCKNTLNIYNIPFIKLDDLLKIQKPCSVVSLLDLVLLCRRFPLTKESMTCEGVFVPVNSFLKFIDEVMDTTGTIFLSLLDDADRSCLKDIKTNDGYSEIDRLLKLKEYIVNSSLYSMNSLRILFPAQLGQLLADELESVRKCEYVSLYLILSTQLNQIPANDNNEISFAQMSSLFSLTEMFSKQELERIRDRYPTNMIPKSIVRLSLKRHIDKMRCILKVIKDLSSIIETQWANVVNNYQQDFNIFISNFKPIFHLLCNCINIPNQILIHNDEKCDPKQRPLIYLQYNALQTYCDQLMILLFRLLIDAQIELTKIKDIFTEQLVYYFLSKYNTIFKHLSKSHIDIAQLMDRNYDYDDNPIDGLVDILREIVYPKYTSKLIEKAIRYYKIRNPDKLETIDYCLLKLAKVISTFGAILFPLQKGNTLEQCVDTLIPFSDQHGCKLDLCEILRKHRCLSSKYTKQVFQSIVNDVADMDIDRLIALLQHTFYREVQRKGYIEVSNSNYGLQGGGGDIPKDIVPMRKQFISKQQVDHICATLKLDISSIIQPLIHYKTRLLVKALDMKGIANALPSISPNVLIDLLASGPTESIEERELSQAAISITLASSEETIDEDDEYGSDITDLPFINDQRVASIRDNTLTFDRLLLMNREYHITEDTLVTLVDRGLIKVSVKKQFLDEINKYACSNGFDIYYNIMDTAQNYARIHGIVDFESLEDHFSRHNYLVDADFDMLSQANVHVDSAFVENLLFLVDALPSDICNEAIKMVDVLKKEDIINIAELIDKELAISKLTPLNVIKLNDLDIILRGALNLENWAISVSVKYLSIHIILYNDYKMSS
ncbi:hypothetical protein GJ496_009343 [Pomphorhynchus laevis]|nr:hypothetical protein GJ496_009343 [Pomphorhynchus laevis]